MSKRAVVFSLIVVNGFLNGCSHFKPDNLIEEALEEGIEYATGLDVDLSADDEVIGN